MLAERERSMCCISRTYLRGGIATGNVGALEGTTKNNRLINLLNMFIYYSLKACLHKSK